MIAGLASSFVGAEDKPVLRVLTFYDPTSRNVSKQVHHFEAKADCWVEWQFLHQDELGEVLKDDLESFDVVAVDEPWVPGLHHRLLAVQNWPYATLFPEGPNASQLDRASDLAIWNEVLWGRPILINFYLYVYRSDILEDPTIKDAFLEQHGRPLKAPNSFQSLLELAAFFEEHTNMSGFATVARISESSVVDFLCFLAGTGQPSGSLGELAAVDIDKLKTALSAYAALHYFRPEGSDQWFVEDVNTAYVVGEVPQLFQWSSLLNPLRDPLYVRAGAQTGFQTLPLEHGPRTATGVWFFSMPRGKSIEKTQLGVEFVNWFREQLPPDLSAESEKFFGPEGLIESVYSRPKMVHYKEFSQTIQKALTDLLQGDQPVEDIASTLRDELKRLHVEEKDSL
ncbi:MAG: hypothetical protein AAF546_08975 [Verrucomicrobiota bacterium]